MSGPRGSRAMAAGAMQPTPLAAALLLLAAACASGEGVVADERNHTLWEGELMRMRARKMLALTKDRIVMCFAHPEVSSCRTAEVPVVKPSKAQTPEAKTQAVLQALTAADFATAEAAGQLLPAVPWHEARVFEEPGADRLEVERLGDDRFVVCFERSSDRRIACGIGLLENGRLAPFAAPLALGHGRLVSISVSAAGRRFAVCAQLGQKKTEGNETVDTLEGSVARSITSTSCKWAQNGGSGTAVKWTNDQISSVAVL
eukprot:TRINITY_DN51693_c0_g1_i1.p1 TRINITY_DN51693_c0_g1~~TRINITY_DN51693_c0_g1_i1.p1  ORF type:complete len:259 (+),score=61.61 TRINITY_DN51693_c0_g1_i1:59-835(+)